MLTGTELSNLDLEHIRRVLSREDWEFMKGLWNRLRTGCKERKSAKKAAAVARNAEIASAVRQGRHEDADRLRWLYYPEKMRKKEIEAQLGKRPAS